MDQWRAAAAAVSHLTQQGVQGGGLQYSYATNSYSGQQQAAPQPSAGSTAYNQAYLQQAAVAQGYANNAAYAGGSTQQLWSQRPAQATDQQSQYGGRLGLATTIPSSGAASANQYASQYGVYGAAAQQQLLGVTSKGVVSASDYQASGAGARSASYGGAQETRAAGSGASYVAGGGGGGGVSSVSVSGVYGGGADSSKYVPSAGYASAGLTATTGMQYNTTSSNQKAEQQQQYGSYPSASAIYGVDQLQQLQQGDGRYQQYQTAAAAYQQAAYRDGDASGLLGALGGAFNAVQQASNVYASGSRGGQPVYPASPSVGYGGVSLPPGRDYGTGRVSTGGSLFQREGSYGRSDRPSIGSSRFEDRGRDFRDRDDDRRGLREHDREREREIERERERERERELVRVREHERERRERDREKERERERERREEERRNRISPIRSRRDSPKREEKRKDSPRRESAHRHSSPGKDRRRDYVCKIDGHNLVEAVRDFNAISKRYSKLFINPDFSKLHVSWMGKENSILFDKAASFEHDSVDVEDEDVPDTKEALPEKKLVKGSTIWNARVMLMSGLTDECREELLSDKNNDKPPNFHKMLKFVALRRDRNAIMPPGGRWDKGLDGGDPANDEGALIRTAVRTVKESIQLDLAECKEWVRIAEIHFDRTDEEGSSTSKEITVFLLPRISDCLPSLENWQLHWNLRNALAKKTENSDDKKGDDKEDAEVPNGVNPDSEADVIQEEKNEDRKEDKKEKERDAKEKLKEEEVPAQPGFVLLTKRTKTTKMRSMTISLDGLLDYDENDRDESSFELSLFAEVFAEMLQYKMGSQILENLQKLRRTSHARKREEKKRTRQSETAKEDSKRAKTEAAVMGETTTRSEQTSKAEQTAKDDAVIKTSEEDTDLKAEEGLQVKESQQSETQENPTTAEVHAEPNAKELAVEDKEEGSRKEKNGKREKDGSSKRRKTMVDKELLKAYRYFDKNRAGYLKADDLKRLLHSLGRFLTPKLVKDLASCAVSESGKSRDDKVVYKNLAEKEVVP